MTSNIMLDSSLLIEYIKGAQRDFLNILLNETGIELFISQTVISEHLFHHLALHGQKAPRTLKENTSIPGILTKDNPLPFLKLFSWLPDNASMLQPAVELMSKYNLLPNDALLLAACKTHGIQAFASFDPDFVAPCLGEGIHLLQTPADFQRFKESLG